MKKLSCFIVLFFIAFTGCANYQSSTKEEALYVAEHTEDFQKMIQYVSVSSFGFPILWDPFIYHSMPEIDTNISFIHQIIYKTKEGEIKLIFLSDDHPPKIVATIIIK